MAAKLAARIKTAMIAGDDDTVESLLDAQERLEAQSETTDEAPLHVEMNGAPGASRGI